MKVFGIVLGGSAPAGGHPRLLDLVRPRRPDRSRSGCRRKMGAGAKRLSASVRPGPEPGRLGGQFHERQQETLTEVIGMRQRVIDLKGQATRRARPAESGCCSTRSRGQLSRQLNSFINVVVERYPEIKGDQLYSDLMTQLEGTENRIAQERRAYNEAVREYNVFRQKGVRRADRRKHFRIPVREDNSSRRRPKRRPRRAVKDAFNNGGQTQPQGDGNYRVD